MSMVSLDFSESFSRSMNDLLDTLSHDPKVLTMYNTIIGNKLNEFVPLKSGALRGSMTANAEGVHWGAGLPYARYQYEGEVYEVNKAIYRKGRIVGWKSPVGIPKTPSGRELGVPGELDGWVFGYTTPGTMHHWDLPYTGQQWGRISANQQAVKADINLMIYRNVVAPICRRRKV